MASSMGAIIHMQIAMAQTTVPPSEQRFQQQVSLTMEDGAKGVFGSVKIPGYQRAVIEFISVSATVPTGSRLNASLTTTVNSQHATYTLPLSVRDSGFDGADTLNSNQLLRVYADPGSTIYLVFMRPSTSGRVTVSIALSGSLSESNEAGRSGLE
jgi:hypothetical protein